MMTIPRPFLPFALTLLSPVVLEAVVINEIHYNPPENTVRQEFIELYNPGDAVADLTGWRLSGAVNYAFPSDTSIPAGGYLVIAEDPPTLLSTLSATAVGPYAGNLDSEGETVRLRDVDDAIVDETDYKVGFPWPVASNGDGASIELINPSLDNALGSSWRASQPDPTPGAQNSVFAANSAPAIRKVTHAPQQPVAADPVVITALVTDPEVVATVTLEYQVVAPGAYVPSHDPLPIVGNNINLSEPRTANRSYRSGWTSVPMLDDGAGDDLLAGDDLFTATLPAQAHRTLVRYRITVEDGLGLAAQVPYPDDASLNFAYFVYDGVPDYNGHSAATLQTLPVYHLLTRAEDYAECFAYNSTDQINQGSEARFFYNWSGTIVYDGVVYDNIRYRLRGANGRYHLQGKRSMRFRLNDGHYFQARDQSGKKYSKKWRTLTTGKGFDNRQTQTFALNEAVSMYLFNKVGVPGPDTHWIHWRVIDEEAEAPDQWRGDFQGLNFVLETYDVRFMEAHGLEKGNLYKLINQTRDWEQQQRYQAAGGATEGKDHDLIENVLDGDSDASFISNYVNLDRWNRWHAMAEAIRAYDFWPSSNKNMAYYFEPATNRSKGKLWVLPWDMDASWGPTWNNGHDVVYNALFPSSGGGGDGYSTPELWPDYFNMVREVRDLLWQSDQINPVIDEFSSFITPFLAADAARWKGAPSDAGSYSGLSGAGAISRRALVQDMKNFAFVGGNWPGGSVGTGGRAAHLDTLQASNGEGAQIPDTPTITYTGTAGFPTNDLAFQSSAFSDPQRGDSFGAMEWRIAEITNPNAPAHDPTERFKLEWEADWESGEQTTFASAIAPPTTAVRSGRTYRARVRHKDNTGRWSHWSAPAEFTTTLPDISSYLGSLVISEIMYHPADPTTAEFDAGFTDDDNFEFIEFRNVGPDTLDLTDLRLTKGVDFDFLGTDITSLASGEFVLVVSNRTAFEMRYGAGLPIAGEWDPTDKFDNGGEQIKLSFGAGDAIRDFVYDDLAPWPTDPDGTGVSLTLRDPNSVPDHGLAASWQASSAPQGSPGSEELTGPFAEWLAAHEATNPFAPFGSSSLSNLLAYAVGADLVTTPEAALPMVAIVDDGGVLYPALRYRVRQDASEVTYLVEVSEDLMLWQSGAAHTIQFGDSQDNGDGTHTLTVRSLQSLASKPNQYLRLHVALPDNDPNSFAVWMTEHGATDPFAPFGSSSLHNLLAYAVGADFVSTPEAALPAVAIVDDGGVAYPALRYRLRQDASEIACLVELSEDLVLWQSGAAHTIQFGDSQDNGDGTHTLTVRSLQSLASKPSQHLRLRINLTP